MNFLFKLLFLISPFCFALPAALDIIASNENQESLALAQAITQSRLLADGEGEIQLNNASMINGNVPVNLFLLDKLNPYTLGYLIATWEYRVFITATILGINPFDQFGVNAGKKYTLSREFI